ncbi:MAG: ABC transporter permease [Deltaproteobacteria bacterium]|nr:ABC transporter permease [Deltaproteobacteria bacterium]
MEITHSKNREKELESPVFISANPRWFLVNWNEFWQYRDLLFLFIRKEFIINYRQTILGPLWYLIQPVILTGMLTIVFQKNGSINVDGIPHFLFYFSAFVIWGYFSAAFPKTAESLSASSHLFGKVYFPRLVMPLAYVVSKSLIFFTQLIFFSCLVLYFKIFTPSGTVIHPQFFKIIIAIPVCFLITSLFSLGLGLIFAAMTVKYRDLNHTVSLAIQFLFLGTPIFYSTRYVIDKDQSIFLFNPLVAVIDLFRNAFFGTTALEPIFILQALIISLATVFVGIGVFNYVQRDYIDAV